MDRSKLDEKSEEHFRKRPRWPSDRLGIKYRRIEFAVAAGLPILSEARYRASSGVQPQRGLATVGENMGNDRRELQEKSVLLGDGRPGRWRSESHARSPMEFRMNGGRTRHGGVRMCVPTRKSSAEQDTRLTGTTVVGTLNETAASVRLYPLGGSPAAVCAHQPRNTAECVNATAVIARASINHPSCLPPH